MTNQQIERLIERNRRRLRRSALTVPAASGVLGLVSFAAGCLFPLAELALLFLICAFLCLCFCLGIAFDEIRHHKSRDRKEALNIWRMLGDSHAFGHALPQPTRSLGNNVSQIYRLDPGGKLFPLRQSIRVVDTHHRQQQRLQIVENRLRELRLLQEALSGKIAQLRELGEDYPQGARNLEQLNAELENLRLIHGQIHASCTRLEAIIIGVQRAAQSRQLRRELENLSALVAPTNSNVERVFEAESLEEIERQIGREIETYLQLERETDEHLK